MTQVTVSSKFQVVIPKDVRRQVPVHMGQKLAVIVKEGTITLLPDKPLSALRGFLKGMKASGIREKRDRV
ncbi:MAG: AbrB/MazE/SpoVT family DNA-binding domain-containing protein [Candidatus Omnitrophota bacterium]|nr:AbrB/MazE/SpoVT family DNA-binding domain-containing protein [Candidatus Omnitrophota bacterium]